MRQGVVDMSSREVFIEENGPRDGLQNESVILTVEERVGLIDALSNCGFQRIQIGSFVNSRLVPQMAETERVCQRIGRNPDVIYSALVLNDKGLERALSCGMEHISVFVSASDAHSRKNVGSSIREAIDRTRKVIHRAKSEKMGVQGGVMNAFGCRFEGSISPERVLEIVKVLLGSGVDELNLADTAGIAHPQQVEELVHRARGLSRAPLSLHIHDTFGFGLANVYAAWKAGIKRFDACCGGLGGCPFIPGAAGNVASEDLVHLFESMGVTTGISLEKLSSVVKNLERRLHKALPGRYAHIYAGST